MRVDYEAVIFDCDGVLIDSEPIYNRVLAQQLTELGLPTTTEQSIQRFMGFSLRQCIRVIEEELGRPVPKTFIGEHKERSLSAFESELQLIPGIVEVLNALVHCPIAIASSSGHEELRVSLTATGIYERFRGRIYSAEDVVRGKPHPDLYLHAARQLGVEAASCVVIEDSIAGVRAGLAAGCTVYGYAALVDASALSDAGARVFSQMSELGTVLGLR